MPAPVHVWSDRQVELAELFPKQNEDVHSTVLDGESVLLNLCTGRYCTLNPVGSMIWNLCDGDRSLGQILSTVSDTFEVSVDKARGDLLDLMMHLEQEGLIQTGRR